MIASNDPTYGASLSLIQQATGAPASTARRWKANPASMPPAAARLTRFAVFGDLTEVFGSDWHGFTLAHGKLYAPYHHGGFTPLQIAGMFFELQELRHLRNHTRQLVTELAAEKSTAWANAKIRSLAT